MKAYSFFSVAVFTAIISTFSCSSADDGNDNAGGGGNSSPSGGGGGSSNSAVSCPVSAVSSNSVTCGGETYQTVVIGSQTWFAKNLNYAVEGSKCYDNNLANCVTYGRLYDWATAMALPSSCNSDNCSSRIQAKHRGICPNGWHIPSDADWDVLMDAVGDHSVAGDKLKATSGWYNNVFAYDGSGTDDYDFSALPGGYGWSGYSGSSDVSFVYAGDRGYWWSSTGSMDNVSAYSRYMSYEGDHVLSGSDFKYSLYSVRCLKD